MTWLLEILPPALSDFVKKRAARLKEVIHIFSVPGRPHRRAFAFFIDVAPRNERSPRGRAVGRHWRLH
jgi:hypothetical protein